MNGIITKTLFSQKVIYGAVGLCGLLITTLVVFSPYIPYSVKLNEGDIAPETVVSPRRIELTLNSEPSVTTVFRQGQPIFYKGEAITRDHVDVMRALNIYHVKASALKFFGIFLINFLLFLLLERFVYHFNYAKIYKNIKYFALTYLVILFVVVLARLLQDVDLFPPAVNVYFLIPVPIAAMVLSLLVTPNISLLCGSMIAMLVGIMYKSDYQVFLFLLLTNAVTTFAIFKRYKRTDMIFAGYVIGASNIVFVFTMGLFKEIGDPMWYGANAIAAFANGVVSSMISLAIMPYLEAWFGITTHQSLLELSNLSHPLLKKLMINAPGTYQHSLMVANLAEAAAEAINADVILARVGAYFHDIGKTKRPIFFGENQFSVENPHRSLTPRMSKLVISSHLKDGIEMAQKHKLPKVLHDFILEHHGTTLVSFFYNQALQTGGEETIKEEFRYPGPKPHFKESGILMLADSVEGAVRALDKPSPAKLEATIERVFGEKIGDGQLDECPLSLRELNVIKKTFLRVFKSVQHSRLDYKEELDNILSQTKKNGEKTQS